MRTFLLAAAVARAVLALAAIPLAPFLYREHVAVLVLLRPTKETLLFAGFAANRGDVALPVVVIAAAPLLLLGVWQFFFLGRLYHEQLAEQDLPGVAGRLLPRKRICKLQAGIECEGEKLIFLGRLAAMPSSLIAAAAGFSDFDLKRFLLIDAAGALASLALMLGLGWLLEGAYDSAGPWLTALGVVAIAAVAIVVGRAVTKGAEGRPKARETASKR